MRILIAASECVPFCKTGGLADVIGVLPQALLRYKLHVRIVLPKYGDIDAARHKLKNTGLALHIPLGNSLESVHVWEGKLPPNIPVFFIDHPRYFQRKGLYGGPDGRDFADNDERFILFSKAVLELSKALDFRPDILHCHDWQTGLIPAALATLYNVDAFFLSTASVFTIHNIAYQGIFPKSSLYFAGFSWRDFTPDRLEYYDQLNFLKAGLVYSTLLNTVSPTYAQEIANDPEFGRGMEGVLKARENDLFGIPNGLDTQEWNPARDPYLPARFSVKNPKGKQTCKRELQRELRFPQDPDTPLIGAVNRLTPQKGVDLIVETVPEILPRSTQMVFLGSGDPALLQSLKNLEAKHPGQFAARTGFQEALGHKIYAGCDLFLMPSRFEPCGLGQMIAMRYGSLPVVTRLGGLADTVEPVSLRNFRGTGFVMKEPSASALKETLVFALEVFRDKKRWSRIMEQAMSKDFSWNHSVPDYIKLYRRALKKKRSG